MTVDCQWVEKSLEALFCDRLSEEESSLARAHIENCAACRNEVKALNAINPLIKNHFRRQLAIARRPRVVHRARVFAISGAVATAFVFLLAILIRFPQTPVSIAPVAQPPLAPAASVEPPKPIKADGVAEPVRVKPSAEPSPAADRRPNVSPVTIQPGAPDFLVTDPAGYSHKLEEYRGHLVVIGVWSSNRPESIAAFERLYKTSAANPKLRFLGVTNEHQARPPDTTFPVLYNQGSKLFGAQPGEFVLLGENGDVELRGSLTKDLDSLTKSLHGK